MKRWQPPYHFCCNKKFKRVLHYKVCFVPILQPRDPILDERDMSFLRLVAKSQMGTWFYLLTAIVLETAFLVQQKNVKGAPNLHVVLQCIGRFASREIVKTVIVIFPDNYTDTMMSQLSYIWKKRTDAIQLVLNRRPLPPSRTPNSPPPIQTVFTTRVCRSPLPPLLPVLRDPLRRLHGQDNAGLAPAEHPAEPHGGCMTLFDTQYIKFSSLGTFETSLLWPVNNIALLFVDSRESHSDGGQASRPPNKFSKADSL